MEIQIGKIYEYLGAYVFVTTIFEKGGYRFVKFYYILKPSEKINIMLSTAQRYWKTINA